MGPGVFDLFARGDATVEELLIALQIQSSVLELRPALLERSRCLPALILEGAPVELCDHLSLPHCVALGHRDRIDAPGDERADFHVLVENRGAGSPYDELIDDRLARHFCSLGDDRRDLGRLRFLLFRRFAAARDRSREAGSEEHRRQRPCARNESATTEATEGN